MDKRKSLLAKIIILIILQLVFVYGFVATLLEFCLLYYTSREMTFWEYLSYFVLTIMAISLAYSVYMTKHTIETLPE